MKNLKNDNAQRREVVKYINGYKVTNTYPILTKEEKEQRENDVLIRLYRYFSKEE